MTFDLVIKNGTVVTSSSTFRADVGIKGEKISTLGQDLYGQREIDASGQLVTPGAVDIHVHLQYPLGSSLVSADDFFTGTRAAAFGGTTTVIDFVERKPDESMVEAIEARKKKADPKIAIDYGLHMTLGPREIPILDQVPAAYEAGCASFKLYMAYGFRLDDAQLLLALEAVRDVSGLPVIHTENWDIICALVQRNRAEGRTKPCWHPRSRPAILEGEAAGRAIDIATYVGTRLHIFHVSCAQVIERIATARNHGLPVTGETCPQYLFLTQDAYDAPGLDGTLPVCAPPLRTRSDQQALWTALSNGDLQIVSTDHCPFLRADKARGLDDYSQIPGGVPSIEMRFPAIFSKGVSGGLLSASQWVDMCCTTPARLAGLEHKGELTVGYDADLVVFDPETSVKFSTEIQHENVDWTPYAGLEIQGWPTTTISRGEVIVESGKFSGEPGRGRFISRSYH
jgi:dihydropyrimidinase